MFIQQAHQLDDWARSPWHIWSSSKSSSHCFSVTSSVSVMW